MRRFLRGEFIFWREAATRLPLHKFLQVWLANLWIFLTTGKTIQQTMAQEIIRLREVERQEFIQAYSEAALEDWHNEFGDRD